MKNKIDSIAKRIIAIAVLVVLVGNAVEGIVTFASANYDDLGTFKSLGSPVINPNFVSDDWHKWELVVWGIYLSNFCVPLVDDYESALSTTSKRGSQGSGYKALQFGTGSDAVNADVIKNLLSYAISRQKEIVAEPILVSFVKIDKFGKIIEGTTNPENESQLILRNANILDLFLMPVESGSDLKKANDNGRGWFRRPNINDVLIRPNYQVGISTLLSPYEIIKFNNAKSNTIDGAGNESYSHADAEAAYLPTFWVRKEQQLIKILDYTDSLDYQMTSLMLAKASMLPETKNDFIERLGKELSATNPSPILFDCFGNIVTPTEGNKVVAVPASTNKHLTKTPMVNLLNSFIFNGDNNFSSPDNIMTYSESSSYHFLSGLLPGGEGVMNNEKSPPDKRGGLNAFGSMANKVQGGTVYVFYDMDSLLTRRVTEEASKLTPYQVENAAGWGEVSLGLDKTYGDLVKELLSININKPEEAGIPLKIEALYTQDNLEDIADDKVRNLLGVYKYGVSFLPDSMLTGLKDGSKYLTEMTMFGKKIPVFGRALIVPVQTDSGVSGSKRNANLIGRKFWTYVNDIYNGKGVGESNSGNADISKEWIDKALDSSAARNNVNDGVATINSLLFASSSGNGASELLIDFLKNNSAEFGYTGVGSLTLNKKTPFASAADSCNNILDKKQTDLAQFANRLVKIVPFSETLTVVNDILGVREGTNFALYANYLYLTYLDWYGIKVNSASKKAQDETELDTRLFANRGVEVEDIEDIVPVKTEEDKKQDILDYTHMLLNPASGSQYKTQLIVGGLTDLIYDTYQKVVYGNATSYNSAIYSGLSSRSNTGFLTVDNYTSNFVTSWLTDIYAMVALVIILVCVVLIIIVGLLRNRKVTWFVVTIVVTVTSIVVVPSLGDIAPAIANSTVQNMFSSKMTLWAISESISNSNLEAQFMSEVNSAETATGSMKPEERELVVQLVKDLNVVYLDRALMVRKDISNKTTLLSNYEAVQHLQSTRWMLPMVMRQFTANDKSMDYVYVPLADIYDDIANSYWYFNIGDAVETRTINGQQLLEKGKEPTQSNYIADGDLIATVTSKDRRNVFMDYVFDDRKTEGKKQSYSSYSYTAQEDLNKMVHTYSYLILKRDNMGIGAVEFSPAKRQRLMEGDDAKTYWSKYVSYVKDNSGTKNLLLSVATDIETHAGYYDRNDRGTVESIFNYVWNTETVYPYFYAVVKDTFASDHKNIGNIAHGLQGEYVKPPSGVDAKNEDEVRISIMHQSYEDPDTGKLTGTGYLRDIMDLEEFFTNFMPYIYQTYLTVGGMDGESGLFGPDDIIERYEMYAGLNKSWLFRSNWAIKIMESPELTKAAMVTDANGNRHTVQNPTLPWTYPANRPMVFSEAQMHEMGLEESNLNIVELRILKVNEDIHKRWTYLINYVNTPGVTAEVLMRQMATEAVIAFNSNMSPSGLFSGAYISYPNTVELRAISFDSVMKMLMLNITRNSDYIYGDTMKSMIANADLFTISVLLLVAVMCTFIIPLVRNILLGGMFVMGICSALKEVFADNSKKIKVSAGFLISNLLFLVITVAYYSVFSSMISINSPDSVLSVQSVQVNAGNPMWCLLVITIISAAYIFALYKMFIFCFKNVKDMGFEAYRAVTASAFERAKSKVESVKEKITNGGVEVSTTTGNILGGDAAGTTNGNAKGASQTQGANTGASQGEGRGNANGATAAAVAAAAVAAGAEGASSNNSPEAKAVNNNINNLREGDKTLDNSTNINEAIIRGKQTTVNKEKQVQNNTSKSQTTVKKPEGIGFTGINPKKTVGVVKQVMGKEVKEGEGLNKTDMTILTAAMTGGGSLAATAASQAATSNAQAPKNTQGTKVSPKKK